MFTYRSGSSIRWQLHVSVALVVAAALSLAACSSGNRSERTSPNSTPSSTSPLRAADGLSGTITVSAAASLTEVFSDLADRFMSDHPDTDIKLNFGSSGQLAEQIRNGAPADVAAFADTEPMNSLSSGGLLMGRPTVFARNSLAIVTKPGNPTGIRNLSDLASASQGVLALCRPEAPCGKFAQQVLTRAGVTVDSSRVSLGQDVKATLGAVSNGDATAGIVYVTDAKSAGDRVAVIAIPPAENATADYPIGVIKGSRNADLARSFLEYVSGDDGRTLLSRFGFIEP